MMRSIFLYISIFMTWSSVAQDLFSLSSDTTKILIGEQVVLSIDYKLEKGVKFNWPEIGDSINGFEIVKVNRPDTVRSWFKRFVHQEITITSWDTGFFVVKPFELIRENDTLKTDPMMIQVLGVEINEDQNYYDIKGPYEAEAPFNWLIVVLLAAIGVIGLILFYHFVIKKKKEVELKKTIPPFEEAMSGLNKLKEKESWNQENLKLYYSDITDIVKKYLEFELKFPAMEMISTELLDHTIQFNWLEEKRSNLKALLKDSDFVKFAKGSTSRVTAEDHLNHAIDFVKYVRSLKIAEEEKENSEKVNE